MKNAGINGVLLGLLFLAPVFAAQASTGLTIQPVKVSQTMEKGGSVSGYILLSNASEAPVVVDMKVEDFIPNAGGDGVKFVSRSEGVTTVRDWITLNGGKSEITLGVNEQIQVPYTINAPANAEPGSHLGVIFFKAIDAADADKQLKIGTQVGTLVFVTIPGNHLQKGNILEFTGPAFVQQLPIVFRTKFENTGTVHFEPKGTIRITNLFGKEVAQVPVEGQVVLPTGVKELNTAFNADGVMLGRYTASIELFDGEGGRLSSQDHVFYVVPVWYILGFIIVLLVIYFGLSFLRSRIKISVKLK